MVYAMGNDRTFVTKKPIKAKRVQSDQAKKISEYMRTHKISVQTDSSGAINIKSEKL